MDQCRKLKTDGVSDYPYISAWTRQWPTCHGACSRFGMVRAPRFSTRTTIRCSTSRSARSSRCIASSTRRSWSSRHHDPAGRGGAQLRHRRAHLHGGARVRPEGVQHARHVTDRRRLPQCLDARRHPLDLRLDRGLPDGRQSGGRIARLESDAVLRRQGHRRQVPRRDPLGARFRSRHAAQGGDRESRGAEILLPVEGHGGRDPAAGDRDHPRRRQDHVVPGMGLVHDGRGPGLHPRRAVDRRADRQAARQGGRAEGLYPE